MYICTYYLDCYDKIFPLSVARKTLRRDVKFQKKKERKEKIAQVSFQMGACAFLVSICILFIVLCYLLTYIFLIEFNEGLC